MPRGQGFSVTHMNSKRCRVSGQARWPSGRPESLVNLPPACVTFAVSARINKPVTAHWLGSKGSLTAALLVLRRGRVIAFGADSTSENARADRLDCVESNEEES